MLNMKTTFAESIASSFFFLNFHKFSASTKEVSFAVICNKLIISYDRDDDKDFLPKISGS